jgi:hypothetical protein
MLELLLKLQDFLGLAYWAEIKTESPKCTYYFGPFLTEKEAKSYHSGYLEDLKAEGAKDIKVAIKRCKPRQLTIFDEATEENFKKKIVNLTEQIL